MSCAVIFGGTGFIGAFFAKMLLDEKEFSKVYLYDIESPEKKESTFRRGFILDDPRMVFIRGDVRSIIEWSPSEEVTLIANFAAVHREPGHEDFEYYETNLLGAENVCAWAVKVNCNSLIFTSSISPYGPSESQKNENSLPIPMTAYGGSKLVAEKIHLIWQASAAESRRLVIVRPGVVFGPGEGGNVSRLIKAVLGRYFLYMGNRNTRKAGVYVKELCNAMYWVLSTQSCRAESVSLFNMSMNPGPSIQEYVESVCRVSGVSRTVLQVPYPAILITSHLISCLASPFGIKHPFSPVRIKKLVRSNNVFPEYLVRSDYNYKYTLDGAFEDWKINCPEEWR